VSSGDSLKNNRAFEWATSAVLAVGIIAGVAASAYGQKAASGLAGGKAEALRQQPESQVGALSSQHEST
jgi:hypothetical protein